MTRGYLRPPWMALPWKEKAKVSLSLPLLRAEGGDEEAQVGLEAIAEAVVLPLPPDKASSSMLPEDCTVAM